MTTHSTTLSTWAGAIASALEHRGIDSAQAFKEAGLDIGKTLDANERFPVSGMRALWQNAVALTGDPAFGLSVPKFSASTTFHGMGLAVDACATLHESLECLVKLSRLVSNVADIKLEQQTDKNWTVDWHIPSEIRKVVAHEAMDAFLYTLVARLEPGDVAEVHFIRPEPEDPAPWHQAFGAPIRFSADTDQVIIRDEAMHKVRQPSNPALAQAGESVALDYLQKLERENVVLAVENEIRHRLEKAEPKQQEIADALNLSVRQLQRKLSAQETSFAQMLKEVRHRLAKEYLADPGRAIVEISLSLGFQDQSNFASAFRRWEGVSPSAFRANYRQQ